MTKIIEIEGESFEIKTYADWTAGEYAEIMDQTSQIDPFTARVHNLAGKEMLMTVARGVVTPKFTDKTVITIPLKKLRLLFREIKKELDSDIVPLSDKPTS